MEREIKINVVNPLSLTTFNAFILKIEVISELLTLNSTFIWTNALLPPDGFTGTSVSAAGTADEIRNNLFNALVFRYLSYPFISVIQNVDLTVSIYITADEVTSSTTNNITSEPGAVTIVHSNVIDPEPPAPFANTIVLSRSPYFVDISPGVPFDRATMELRLYRGNETDDYPLTANYNLSKTVVQAGQEIIVFDIQNLVNDFVKNNIGIFGTTGTFLTSSLDSVWVKAFITAYYQGELVGTANRAFLGVDGFGYHTELYNPIIDRKVLSSINEHIFFIGNNYPLYFTTFGLTSITVNGVDVPFTFDQMFNNQVIAYINVAPYATGTTPFDAVFVYGSGETAETITHNFTPKSECRYQVVNLYFKNKFGFWETISFSKVSKHGLGVDSSDYQAIISNFGQYNLNSHGRKTFIVEGKGKVTLNTDFLPEAYNEIFRQMLLSEFVYLEEGGQILPVNIMRKSIEFKTKNNDKLIQYAMDFEYSFNEINMVK